MTNTSATQSVWNPWHELNTTFDDALQRLFGIVPEFTPMNDYPPVNVWKDESKVVISAKLPGARLEDIDITIRHETLNLKCKLDAMTVPEGAVMKKQERLSGSFSRAFSLPFPVDEDAVEATYQNGILNITLPKAKSEQPRKIAIKSEN